MDAITILKSPGLNALSESEQSRDCFVRGGDGSQILDHEYCFFFGDLNYRIDIPRDQCIRLIEKEDWQALWAGDQLIRQRYLVNTTCLLRIFDESPLLFAPTYKYDPGTDQYDSSEKKRTPAYCDRILFRDGSTRCLAAAVDPAKRIHHPSTMSPPNSRGASVNVSSVDLNPHHTTPPGHPTSIPSRIHLQAYRRYECRISDHRPIGASFTVTTKRVDPHRKLDVLSAIQSEWKLHYERKLTEASISWLMDRVEAISSDATSYQAHVQQVFLDCNGDLGAALHALFSNS